MSFATLRRSVIIRLDQSDRGDRGWFLTTRVHLSPARLRDTCTYLANAGGRAPIRLGTLDYAALAAINGVGGNDPGMTLRRHYLLAMERPLRLLQRTNGDRWGEIVLTDLGVSLATEADTSGVLEMALAGIVFCRSPWYTDTRIAEYSMFNVRPLAAALRVMTACDGSIDRDEYDLFVSRIRTMREISWAVRGVREFRTLTASERLTILSEVRTRIPGAKRYQNWRDMSLHTFSLLGLGQSAIRVQHRLVLTQRLVEQPATAPPATRPRATRRSRAVPTSPAPQRPPTTLLIPAPLATSELATPPAPPASNSGSEGEILIGKLLEAAGWSVVYYTNRRGFGFDIWARRGDSAIVVEVKSSVGTLSTITLTQLEFQSATHHRANYLLATVENLSTENPLVGFVQDPILNLKITEHSTNEYHITRAEWGSASRAIDALDTP